MSDEAMPAAYARVAEHLAKVGPFEGLAEDLEMRIAKSMGTATYTVHRNNAGMVVQNWRSNAPHILMALGDERVHAALLKRGFRLTRKPGPTGSGVFLFELSPVK